MLARSIKGIQSRITMAKMSSRALRSVTALGASRGLADGPRTNLPFLPSSTGRFFQYIDRA